MIKLGTSVFVWRYSNLGLEFLIGQRGAACQRAPFIWALPGGMLIPHESIGGCAKREVKEETGLDVYPTAIDNWQTDVVAVTHDLHDDIVTAWVMLQYLAGTPVVMEPDKCLGWKWVITNQFFATVPQHGEQARWTPLALWYYVEAMIRSRSVDQAVLRASDAIVRTGNQGGW